VLDFWTVNFRNSIFGIMKGEDEDGGFF